MAITVPTVDRASAWLSSSNTLTINKAANVADGDYLVASVHYSITAGTIGLPAGWTTIYTQNTQRTYHMAYKYVPSAAAETATDYAFPMTGGSGRLIGTIFRVVGMDPVTPIDVVGTMSLTGSTTAVAPSITVTNPNALLWGSYWNTDATQVCVMAVPGSMTQLNSHPVTNGTATTTMCHGIEQLSAAGATGTRTATVTPGASSGPGALLVSLNPLVVDPTFTNVVRGGPSLAAMHASIW